MHKKQFDKKHFEAGRKKLKEHAFIIPHDKDEFQIDGTLRTRFKSFVHEHRDAASLNISKHMNGVIGAQKFFSADY